MKRGDIWTVAGAGYSGKPRPAVIIQDDAFDLTDSITVCLFTSVPADAGLIRLSVEPDPSNGSQRPSHLMIDKIMTIRRDQADRQIGTLSKTDITRLDQSLMVFLGLARPRR